MHEGPSNFRFHLSFFSCTCKSSLSFRFDNFHGLMTITTSRALALLGSPMIVCSSACRGITCFGEKKEKNRECFCLGHPITHVLFMHAHLQVIKGGMLDLEEGEGVRFIITSSLCKIVFCLFGSSCEILQVITIENFLLLVIKFDIF